MLLLILVLFLLSGACGLVYEITWSREFALILGGTTHAVTTVVATFMAGLALGGLWGGRLIDRRRGNPLLVYGLLEGGIGILAPLAPLLIHLSHPLLAAAYRQFGGQSWLFILLRFAVCALVLLPPTVMMGATLPILIRATMSSREKLGLTTGRLYSLNTAGAVVGVALAGFLLLPTLGCRVSSLIAGGINLAICVTALILSGRFRPPVAVADPPAPPSAVNRSVGGERRMGKIVLIGYAVSGLAALIFQIAWTRALTLTLGGSTYTFSLIVITYLAGLALGGSLITPLADRVRRPLLLAGLLEFLIAFAALAVLPLFDVVNEAMFGWVHYYSGGTLSLIRFAAVFGLIALPTMAMGTLLPLLVRAMAGSRKGVGEIAGRVYFANTTGAVIGALLAGFLLIDLMGINRTIMVAGVGSLLIGTMWILTGGGGRRSRFVAAVGLTGGLAVVFLLPEPDPLLRNSGPYIYAERIISSLPEGGRIRDHYDQGFQVIYFREDSETTVSVFSDRGSGDLSLRINGKVDASSFEDMPTQVLIGHLPLLLHPAPRRAMVLGLASGATAGSALSHPLDRLDCLEFSPAVVEASHLFGDYNDLDQTDARFNLILADGRNHLALTDEKYDVIISEPSNPWQAGMTTLFTVEYFELLRERLNPGGLATIWLGVYDMTVESATLIIRSFAEVFPHLALWEASPGSDYLLTGSVEPIQVDYRVLAERCGAGSIAANLGRVGFGLDDILAGYLMNGDLLRLAAGPGPLHTDDRRQIEFELAVDAFRSYSERFIGIADSLLARHMSIIDILALPPGGEGERVAEHLRQLDGSRDEFMTLKLALLAGGIEPDSLIMRAADLRAATGDIYSTRHLLVKLVDRLGILARAKIRDDRAAEAVPLLVGCLRLIGDQNRPAADIARLLLDIGEPGLAEEWSATALKRDPADHLALAIMARVAQARRDHVGEELFWRLAVESCPVNLSYRVSHARPLLALGRLEEAMAELEFVLARRPNLVDAHIYLGGVLLMAEEWTRARFHLRRALELNPEYPSRSQTEAALRDIELRLGDG
ncbi:MAG: hypothetical protein GY835_12330 [bacterium]|nr:hypothetical protein [bacterium]